MRRVLLATVFALVAVPALAGSITISITSAPITGSKTYTITDADSTKFIAWCKTVYVSPVDGSQLTSAQCLAAWADGLMAGTVNNVTGANRAAAASTASSSVSPIDIH